jgi:hypothetical protein
VFKSSHVGPDEGCVAVSGKPRPEQDIDMNQGYPSPGNTLGGGEPDAHQAMGRREIPLRSISPNRCEFTEQNVRHYKNGAARLNVRQELRVARAARAAAAGKARLARAEQAGGARAVRHGAGCAA